LSLPDFRPAGFFYFPPLLLLHEQKTVLFDTAILIEGKVLHHQNLKKLNSDI
jgi:hypothetical protein